MVFADDDESMLLALGDSEEDGGDALALTTSSMPLQPSHLSPHARLSVCHVVCQHRGNGAVRHVEMGQCGSEHVPYGVAHLTRDSHACKNPCFRPYPQEAKHLLKMQVTDFAPARMFERCTEQIPFPPEFIEVQDTGCAR